QLLRCRWNQSEVVGRQPGSAKATGTQQCLPHPCARARFVSNSCQPPYRNFDESTSLEPDCMRNVPSGRTLSLSAAHVKNSDRAFVIHRLTGGIVIMPLLPSISIAVFN